MTFIAGFKCYDGIVLCSDSEESDGYTKKIVNKLFQSNIDGEWGLAVAGAGPGHIIDSYWDKLRDYFQGHLYDRQSIVLAIEESLKQTFSVHTTQDDYFRIGVGIFDAASKESRIYLSAGHCLAPKDEYFCLGTGDNTLANCIVSTIFDKLMSVQEAIRLGVFVTDLMKDHSAGVGGPTEIVSYANGEPTWKRYDPGEIATFESTVPKNKFYWNVWNFWDGQNSDVRKRSIWQDLGKRKSFKPSTSQT